MTRVSGDSNLAYSKVFFCQKCITKVDIGSSNSKQRTCSVCGDRLGIYYFLPLKPQIKMLFDKKVLPVTRDLNKNDEFISDVFDSNIYQDFLNKENPNRTNKKKSMSLNSDGISLCEKSNLAIWPVYLNINEIDKESRFHIDNTLIAGKFYIVKFIHD